MGEHREKAKHLGMTESEYEDFQIWIRHGRVGVGRTYQEEVVRAQQIEHERRVMNGPSRCTVPGGCSDFGGPCPSCEPIALIPQQREGVAE